MRKDWPWWPTNKEAQEMTLEARAGKICEEHGKPPKFPPHIKRQQIMGNSAEPMKRKDEHYSVMIPPHLCLIHSAGDFMSRSRS